MCSNRSKSQFPCALLGCVQTLRPCPALGNELILCSKGFCNLLINLVQLVLQSKSLLIDLAQQFAFAVIAEELIPAKALKLAKQLCLVVVDAFLGGTLPVSASRLISTPSQDKPWQATGSPHI